MNLRMKHNHLFTFGLVMLVAWGIGTFPFIYFNPHFMYGIFQRAIVQHGLGGGPIPVNTLYAVPNLASPSMTGSNLLTTGANHDTLYISGWLDLSKGPQVLHVPDMAGRYYSVQFTDPSDGTDFAYVGKRTTGTEAGDYLITAPGWKGTVPQGMKQISSPNNSVLVIGRVLVESDSDLSTAQNLEKQIQLTPLSQWQSGQ
jgi:hypothetical protein